MKKLFTNLKVALTLLLLCGVCSAWAETVTSTFTNKDWNVGENEVVWTAAGTTANSFETASPSRGVQIMLNSIKNSGLTLTNSSIKNLGAISKVEIVYSSNCAGSADGTIAVAVGSTNFGSAFTIKKENNVTISFENATAVKDDIVISFTSKVTSKSVYVKSITVTYEDGPAKLSTPTNLEATNVTLTSATLSWDAVENASSYEVCVNGETLTATTNSLFVEELTASTAYTWTVKAVGDGTAYTDSEESEESNFTTLVLPTIAYTVSFDGNNHGTPASASITETEPGAGIALPGCANVDEGLMLVGWCDNQEGEGDVFEVGATFYPTNDVTLFAKYQYIFTINYMVNGVNTNPQVNVAGGTELVFPEVSAPDPGHVFCGWVTQEITGPLAAAPEYVNTEGLTAQWSETFGFTTTYYAVFAEHEGGEKSESLACPEGTISDDIMTYKTTNFEIVHAKGTSSNFAVYSPWRIYQNNKVTVSSESKTISKLEMVTSGTYYGAWDTTSGTVTVAKTSGGTTSVTGVNAKTVTLKNTGTVARWSNITIYYNEVTYSNWCTTVAEKVLTGIELSGDYPTELWKGEAFSNEGMTVTAFYDDDTSKDVTASAEFTGYDMSTVGNQTVTVTYDGKSATYDINVKTIANTAETAYTVAEAKDLIDAGKDLATPVYVKGKVSSIVTEWNSQYGNISFDVSADGTAEGLQFRFYRNFKGADKTQWASADECPAAGDEVIGYGTLTKYGDTYEFAEGNYFVSQSRDVEVSSVGWATVCLPFRATITSDNATAYYVIGTNGSALTKDEADVIPAGTGVLLKSNNGGAATVTFTASAEAADDATGNMMVGSLTETTFAEQAGVTYYILTVDDNDNLGFYWDPETNNEGKTATCPAGKAVLAVPTTGGNAKMFFNLDDDATGINNVEMSKMTNGIRYNLNGQAVGNDFKGVVIVNGKKFVK